MGKVHDNLMIAVSAPPQQGKSESIRKLIDLLYDELVIKRSADGWTAEFLNTRCKPPRMQPYIPSAYTRPDKMVVFKQNGVKRIAIVTWGDELDGPVLKSFTEILIDIEEYDIIVGCCHTKGDVWNYFKRKIKPLVSTFVVLSTYRLLKPLLGFDKWNVRLAEHLEEIVLDKLSGKL